MSYTYIYIERERERERERDFKYAKLSSICLFKKYIKNNRFEENLCYNKIMMLQITNARKDKVTLHSYWAENRIIHSFCCIKFASNSALLNLYLII